MKTNSIQLAIVLTTILFVAAARAADAQLDSWLTTYSGQYARLYTSDANKASGTSVTTWSRGSTTQSLPLYCGVQAVYSSTSWVYLRSTGMGSHIMGPWYLNAGHTMNFPNFPTNQHALYRFPRSPATNGTHAVTDLGAIGYFVDGVAMFDSRDGFHWTGSGESGSMGNFSWNRDAWVNEGVTFDPG